VSREDYFTIIQFQMKNKLLLSVAAAISFLFPSTSFEQVINLGTAADFALFTTVGAIGNTGISQITGSVGTNSGGTTGFGNVNGVMHSGDGATASATNNLLTAYNQLNSAIPTAVHAPLLGNGETLTAGVYDISGVTVLSNTLTLDALGNANAVFIFKVSAAFSSTTASQVNLINNALACNVYWKVEGAVTLGSLTVMKGNVVAHNDLIDLATGVKLEGRLLAINGAVTVNGTTSKAPIGCGSAVLNGPAAPDLASAACYGLLSGNDNVSNSGITTVKGDIGTNVGLTTGYNALLVDGHIHSIPDGSTNSAAADLLLARTYLNALTADIELLYPAQFGSGLVLTPHTYVLNGATSLTDTVFLNAEGNANAVFVIKIYGALSTGSLATVSLINGTQAKNVYWIINGAITVFSGSDLKGTIISNNGAINLSTGVKLEGRAMTTNGALTTSSVTLTMPPGCGSLPLSLTAFIGKLMANAIMLNWNTVQEQNTSQFEIEHSNDGRNYLKIGAVNAAGRSNTVNSYSFTDYNAKQITYPVAYYRLKMIDVDGRYTYSAIVALQMNKKATTLSVYPNPVKSGTTLMVTVQKKERVTYTVVDNTGRVVSSAQADLKEGSNSIYINASKLPVGMYTIMLSGTATTERLQFVKQ
jgi:hypothetical protein